MTRTAHSVSYLIDEKQISKKLGFDPGYPVTGF